MSSSVWLKEDNFAAGRLAGIGVTPLNASSVVPRHHPKCLSSSPCDWVVGG